MKVLLLAVCISLAWPQLMHARPVSYPGGVTLMQKNELDKSSLHAHYSPTHRYSIGYLGEYWRDEDWRFHGAQFNYLAKRWNQPAAQANVYIKSGIGFAESEREALKSERETAGFLGLAMDWEDRRYFTSYENRYMHAGKIAGSFSQKARLGFAPYIGDYGDLHTWLMLQLDHRPENADDISITPLVRLFKSDYMAELGMSTDQDVLFNLTIRF